ncbi:CIA30 family protein [Winogradskyella sp. 3972H.M.0a.05]|uniref:CIA30 family protein n=1 Tax=Winogradskyella sp. 3972H.M.0a.05 TaxID=2950277 RepID=UPI00339B0BBF
MVIYDSTENQPINYWVIVNDGVMGGLSKGKPVLTSDNFLKFYGTISLENNGGFSLIRYRFDTIDGSKYTVLKLRVRGDGKRYQLRAKYNTNDRHSYIAYFITSGQWQTIEIPFNTMIPFLRGHKLNLPNFTGQRLAEVGVLIGNKKSEDFELLIERIVLE